MFAIVGERLREVVIAEMVAALVRPRPLCGRMEWLERAFSIGQGERTSSLLGGDQDVHSMGGWSAGGFVAIVRSCICLLWALGEGEGLSKQASDEWMLLQYCEAV